MAIKSTPERYGTVAIAIHWLSAILVIGLLASGFRAASTMDAAAKAAILRLHVVAGLLVLALTLSRVVWWWMADRKPAPLPAHPLAARAAAAVHVLFYVVLLGMAASGIGMMVLSAAGSVLFGGQAGLLPDFWKHPPRIPHGIGGRLLAALLVLHVGGALYHHFIARDATLSRIGLGRRRG